MGFLSKLFFLLHAHLHKEGGGKRLVPGSLDMLEHMGLYTQDIHHERRLKKPGFVCIVPYTHTINREGRHSHRVLRPHALSVWMEGARSATVVFKKPVKKTMKPLHSDHADTPLPYNGSVIVPAVEQCHASRFSFIGFVCEAPLKQKTVL